MPTDRRLFDSSSMTPPPAPEIDAMTCAVEGGSVPNIEYLKTMFRQFIDQQGDSIIEDARRRLEEVEWIPFRMYSHPVIDQEER
jgi:hypothetical protein